MHQAGETSVLVQGEVFLQFVGEAQIAGLAVDHRTRVLIRRQEHLVGLAHGDAQLHRQFVQPTDLVDAGDRLGLLLRQEFPVPDAGMLVGFAQEQHAAPSRIARARMEQEDAGFLLDAGEPEEIVVGMVGTLAIGRPGHRIVGLDDGKRVVGQAAGESLAVAAEEAAGDGIVTHMGDHALALSLRLAAFPSRAPIYAKTGMPGLDDRRAQVNDVRSVV